MKVPLMETGKQKTCNRPEVLNGCDLAELIIKYIQIWSFHLLLKDSYCSLFVNFKHCIWGFNEMSVVGQNTAEIMPLPQSVHPIIAHKFIFYGNGNVTSALHLSACGGITWRGHFWLSKERCFIKLKTSWTTLSILFITHRFNNSVLYTIYNDSHWEIPTFSLYFT